MVVVVCNLFDFIGAVAPRLSCKNFLSIQEADRELINLNWLVPLEKYDSQDLPVFGSYLAKNSGIYLFIFDNRETRGTARLTEFTIEISCLNLNQGKLCYSLRERYLSKDGDSHNQKESCFLNVIFHVI